MSTKPYPSYKDSGVEWLGRIPAQWACGPVYSRYAVQLGKMLDGSRITGEHLAPYLRNVDVQWGRVNTDDLPQMDFSPADRIRFALRRGDLLVCEGGEVGRAAHWLGELDECYYQKAIHRLRPFSPADEPRFMFYVLLYAAKLGVFVAGGNPNTIDHLPAEKLRKYRFAFPPSNEQQAIAEFLDRETGKIDALVKKKERLIELSQEKRTALIIHAVTQGLNPNAPKKDSGIPWLGHIPKHWEVKPLKRLGALKGGSGFPDSEQGIENEALPFYKVSDMNLDGNEVLMHSHNNSISTGTVRRLGATIFPRDAIIFPKVGAALLTNKRRILSRPACIDNNTMAFTIKDGVVKFLFYRLLCFDLGRLANPGAVPSLNEKEASEIAVAVPPASEQEMIVEFLDRETAKLDALIGKVRTAIERLQEYRTALISAAVTGQIDVRKEAA